MTCVSKGKPLSGGVQQAAVDFVVVIPARYQSSRLPGKVLADINGKPMIQYWCYQLIWHR